MLWSGDNITKGGAVSELEKGRMCRASAFLNDTALHQQWLTSKYEREILEAIGKISNYN